MTTQFKQTIFFKAMQKRETMTGINALLYWNDKVKLISSSDAIHIRNQRANELQFGIKKTFFRLG